jgi:hypothetical protein
MIMSASIVVSPRKAGAEASIPLSGPFGTDYKTWSLFLVCTPSWFATNTDPRLIELYQHFWSFGRAIGAQHLAVWFAKSDNTEMTPGTLASEYDNDRAAQFCQHYGLSPQGAPHVVVTSEYPELTKPPANYVTLSLGRADAETIGNLLVTLTEQIWSSKLDQGSLDNEAWWRSLEQVLRKWVVAASPLFNRLSVRLNVGVLKVEFASAQVGGGKSP